MTEYKEGFDGSYITRIIDGINIPKDEGNTEYQEYLQYVVEGGETDPFFSDLETIENEKKLKYNDSLVEYIRRFNLHTTLTHHGSDWEHTQYYRILNKKIDGTLTTSQAENFAIVNHIRDKVEDLQDYIYDETRTLQELRDLDVSASIWWTPPS